MKLKTLFLTVVLGTGMSPAPAVECSNEGTWVQILGSGGPELLDSRSANSYLVWRNGKARILVDIGSGSALHFYHSGAQLSQLDSILLTNLHVDHAADLPALINADDSGHRVSPLPIYGPAGNKFMPSTISFVRALFDQKRGAFRHLGSFLSPLGKQTYKLQPRDVGAKIKKPGARVNPAPVKRIPVFSRNDITVVAIPVINNKTPTLAYRLTIGDKDIAFASDITRHTGNLDRLAKDVDMLVIGHVTPVSSNGQSLSPYITPSIIGRIAYRANAKQLLLVQRSRATIGKEKQSLDAIKAKYAGLISFANDMDCFQP